MAVIFATRRHPDQVWRPPPTARYLKEGRTIHQHAIVDVDDPRRLFTSGGGNRKVGAFVSKGEWRGMPIFLLTLEERATCPRSCAQWDTCYGNATPFARRWTHGPELERRLEKDLAELMLRHPGGAVVRLHQLGDFYSVAYVKLWERWLDRYPALRVYGYTARRKHSPIGQAILALTLVRWNRFAIRFSSCHGPESASVIWHLPDGPTVRGGIVCPEQLGKTSSCGSCALCWAAGARGREIVFIGHGPYLAPTCQPSRI